MIVAHPDDEIIWCGGLLLAHPQWKVTIMSLCRASDSDRRPRFEHVANHLHTTAIITDLDDRTIKGAEAAGTSLKDFTEGYYQEFLKDLDKLHIKRASEYPKASQHVDDMIDLTKKLLEKGAFML